MKPIPAPKASRQKGFTLIDLMLMTLLLAMLSAIASHTWSSVISRYRVTTATSNIHALLRSARANAISEGSQMICDGDHGCSRFEITRTLWAGHDQNGDGKLSRSEISEHYSLPEGVTLTWKRFRGNALIFGNRGITHFQNGSLYICNKITARRIVMNWIGRPRVETADPEDCR
ncbi:GspH/FimT family protein [Alcanivorax sp. DP30]|uniref:GspH/FimT family pseudopilin n=1 Tax=Alcanivorax sp. DP30 TaxID=2606217 RepID=UPI001369E9D1|nr:GspH/FimT family protein [Alcanivorax sp. DP30]MZR61363.1 hypothetical protein [Alcanivorax sp. DP30]